MSPFRLLYGLQKNIVPSNTNTNTNNTNSNTNTNTYKAIDNNVIIEFNGNNKEEFPITYESLENQMFRASKLLLIIKRRQKN